jgi:F-box protein 3
VPELSRLEELEDRFWFSYSVRMRLLPSHEQGANSLTSCQLSARHWVIRAHDTVNEVRGEAVIGLVSDFCCLQLRYRTSDILFSSRITLNDWLKLLALSFSQFPLLREGDEEFVYESCTGLSAKSGSLDGDFTFTPGRYLLSIHTCSCDILSKSIVLIQTI